MNRSNRNRWRGRNYGEYSNSRIKASYIPQHFKLAPSCKIEKWFQGFVYNLAETQGHFFSIETDEDIIFDSSVVVKAGAQMSELYPGMKAQIKVQFSGKKIGIDVKEIEFLSRLSDQVIGGSGTIHQVSSCIPYAVVQYQRKRKSGKEESELEAAECCLPFWSHPRFQLPDIGDKVHFLAAPKNFRIKGESRSDGLVFWWHRLKDLCPALESGKQLEHFRKFVQVEQEELEVQNSPQVKASTDQKDPEELSQKTVCDSIVPDLQIKREEVDSAEKNAVRSDPSLSSRSIHELTEFLAIRDPRETQRTEPEQESRVEILKQDTATQETEPVARLEEPEGGNKASLSRTSVLQRTEQDQDRESRHSTSLLISYAKSRASRAFEVARGILLPEAYNRLSDVECPNLYEWVMGGTDVPPEEKVLATELKILERNLKRFWYQ